jgi:hypothetical protein
MLCKVLQNVVESPVEAFRDVRGFDARSVVAAFRKAGYHGMFINNDYKIL